MRGGSHAELIGSGVLVSALQLVTGKLLGVSAQAASGAW